MAKVEPIDLSIEAEPTKELFVEMLTRDVALTPAIIDLADNCTDGARHLRDGKTWKGLHIEISASPTKFVISDSCGGMIPDIARTYAFKFGRPKKVAVEKGDVGRFGIGMKRGLFKLGRHFKIQSTTATTHFEVTIDVDTWIKKKDWHFEFDSVPVERKSFSSDKQGTTITVTKLHPEVQDHFRDDDFVETLRDQLTLKLEESIRRGLSVTVNDVRLHELYRTFLASKELLPARKTFTVKGQTGKPVKVVLWCGIGRPESKGSARSESGWYVYCNGRMLLEADQSTATGWGVEEGELIPAYHPQYNDFRGLAYLEADDAGDLPWNTAKTALDIDHPVYRRVRLEMNAIARPVIDFFNKRKDEFDALKAAGEEEPRGRLQGLIEGAPVKSVDKVSYRAVFATPKVSLARKIGPDLQKITFHADKRKAKIVRESVEASTWEQVGDKVFEYYFNSECQDD